MTNSERPKLGASTGERRQPVSRRSVLHYCAICAGAMTLPPAWAALLATDGQESSATQASIPAGQLAFRYFTPEQAAVVEAIAEQVIPTDQDPGARWAGVVHYIDLGLAGDFKQHRPAYEAGLKRLAALTRAKSHDTFATLEFRAQTSVLMDLEKDGAPNGDGINGREFFQLVRQHTIEGFFGDPKYGGNREMIAWKMLKF